VGIFAGIIPLFRSLVILLSLRPILASSLCIQKFRSPRQVSTANTFRQPRILGVLGGQKRRFEPGPQLSRVQSEGFELLAPFCRSITKSLDSNAAWQTTFDRRPHEIWCEERERDGHVDLARAAFLTCCDLLDVSDRTRNDFVKPATTSGDRVYEARATFDPRWANFTFGDAVRDKNLPGFPGWRLLPRD
jgi:hypothetical protein